MRLVRAWSLLLLVLHLHHAAHSFSHWIVTENGRIQPKVDSEFFLRRPYDLLTLLDQEKRSDDLDKVVEELANHKNRIDLKSSKATTSGAQITNDRCVDIFKLRENDNPYMIPSNGSDRFKLPLFSASAIKDVEDEPHCMKYYELPFSVFSYDHLETIKNRREFQLSTHPVLGSYLASLDPNNVGRQIVFGLMKNSSSWFHYNLGMMYWWWKGNGYEAIECARRALYHVPKYYRDIPLLNLGGMLHWSWQSQEATILLKAAVDHAPDKEKNYLWLGIVYGHLKEFEKAIKCFKIYNALQPKDAYVQEFIQCFAKLHHGFLEYHDTLQDILSDLHEYHSQQQRWLSLQERLIWEIAPYEFIFTADAAKKFIDIQGAHSCMRVSENDALSTVRCNFAKKSWSNMQYDFVSNIETVFGLRKEPTESTSVEDEGDIDKEVEIDSFTDEVHYKVMVDSGSEAENMPPLLPPKYPTSMSTSNNMYFDASKWPSKEECVDWNLPYKDQENLDLPIFIPLENKGYQVKKILSESIELGEGDEHELPWYPPLCEHPNADNFEPYVPSAVRQAMLKNKPVSAHHVLKNHFLGYVNNGKGDEAEIGQRIITAVNKKAGPSWVLAMLASMYWRMKSNTRNALTCLDMPVESVSKEFTDVILVSMGSMLQQLGLIENALKIASLAFKVNYLEPSTNFLLALIHYQKNNPVLAMYYMKNVLRVDPDYYDGEAERLLKIWACRVKMGHYEAVHTKEEKIEGMGICRDGDTFSGEGVICSANGDQCKTAAIQCFRTDSIAEDDRAKEGTTKIISSQQCAGGSLGSTSSLISTLLAHEGPSISEPDQSTLESLAEPPQDFHMRIFLGDDNAQDSVIQMGDFYVSIALTVPEITVNVYDKTGTYSLSKSRCKNIKDADWLHFTSMWQSIAARNFNIGPYLNTLSRPYKEVTPHCTSAGSMSPALLDHLTSYVLKQRPPNIPEDSLSEWLGLMAGDQDASVRDVGLKIGIALQKNTTSWVLATAAAFYWRVIGNTAEAITCLRLALSYVPSDMKDVPLISLANVLQRVGFLNDALEVGYIALRSHPNFVVNHFTVGNIHTAMGDFEQAITYYRSSLALDANFEPARNRLTSILCTLLLDESGRFREIVNNVYH